MPLYDFSCDGCGQTHTLLLKYGDLAPCPACGGTKMRRQMAPCAFSGFASKPAAATQRAAKVPAHVHTAVCGCGPSPARSVCAAEAKADALVKKYLD